MAPKSLPVQLSKVEGLGSVTICGCGVVSLHIAGITLRLEAGAFSQLDQLIGSAADELQARQATSGLGELKTASAMIQ